MLEIEDKNLYDINEGKNYMVYRVYEKGKLIFKFDEFCDIERAKKIIKKLNKIL